MNKALNADIEPGQEPEQEIVEADDITRRYIEHSKAANTRRAYRADWQHFTDWCRERNVCPLPAQPMTVANYISDMANTGTLKTTSIARRLAAISKAHNLAHKPNPTRMPEVKTTWWGIKRDHGFNPEHKAAIRSHEIEQCMTNWQPKTLADLRDRAIVLIGYAGAFRRSELVAVTFADLKAYEEGISIYVPKSKTDKYHKGLYKDIHYGENPESCPVKALDAWLTQAGITSGPLFRPIDRHGNIGGDALSTHAVMKIVKRLAPEFGLKPEDVGTHSLRAGMVTDLFAGGTQETVIMQLTGHRDHNTLQTYRREAKRMKYNYVKVAGL